MDKLMARITLIVIAFMAYIITGFVLAIAGHLIGSIMIYSMGVVGIGYLTYHAIWGKDLK